MADHVPAIDPQIAARRALPLLDLTNLDEAADEAAIRLLCARAHTPAGPVAAVCLYPRFVTLAKTLLAHSTVRIATVVNFPAGDADPTAAETETTAAVTAGADEIDVVFPYRAFLAGDGEVGRDLIRRCRRACRRSGGKSALLKVILETGRLGDAATIRRAGSSAIEAGADFVKTSTGKLEPGATIAAATALLEAIVAARAQRQWAGLKVAGGVRTLGEATAYMALGERMIGAEFVGPATFRIGASRLLDDILGVLGIVGRS